MQANALMDKDGKINRLGKQYIGAVHRTSSGAISVDTGIALQLLTIWMIIMTMATRQ